MLAVFGGVDRFGGGAPDAGAGGLAGGGRQPAQQRYRQLQRRLPAELHDHPLRVLRLDHVEHVLQGERLEVEAIAGVVIGGYRFRVAVHHHRGQPLGLQRKGGVHAAVVELDALADAVGAAPQDHHLAAVFGLHLAFRRDQLKAAVVAQALQGPLVGGVVVRGAGGELGGTGVHRFEHRVDPQRLAVVAHLQLVAAGGPGDLAVGEAQLLELQQRLGLQIRQGAAAQQARFRLEDAAQLGQKPRVDRRDAVDVGVAVAGHHRRAHRKDAIGGGGAQLPLQLGALGLGVGAVAAPAGMARLQGTQRLLERLLEAAADGHRLPHRLHRRGEHRRAAAELLKREARDFGDHVINGGLEAGGCLAGDVVEDLVERVAHRQARGDLGDREAGGLGGQGRGARHARVHLDHDHVAIGGVDRELDVAAAGVHPDLADDRDRLVAQALVFAVGEGLGGGHGDRVARVHPHGVEVLDRAHDHHVVGGVAHHLQLEFLPAQQRLLDQDLAHRAGVEAAEADGSKFLRVVGDATAGAPQGEGGANDAGVAADLVAHRLGLLQAGGDAGGAHGHADALHGLLEQVAVLRLLDRRQVGADQLHAVALQGAVLGEGHRQVEGGLAAHGGQQRVGALRLDHPPHHIGGERLDVGAIRHVRIGHDRGGVAVHQHHLKAFGPQGLAGLGAGVIEFAGLTDHDRTRTQQQDATQIRATGHGRGQAAKPA